VTDEVRVLIVDDEEPARLLLREILGALPGVAIVAEAANGFEAVRAASEEKPDVAFLDIEMPKLSGFEVAEILAPEVAVVFVTAYDRYALKAFEIHAADYVLKPYRAERLREALSRACARPRPGVRPRPDPAAVEAMRAAFTNTPLHAFLGFRFVEPPPADGTVIDKGVLGEFGLDLILERLVRGKLLGG